MNIFKIKYYYKTAYRNGTVNDWDRPSYTEEKLNISKNSSQDVIRNAWYKIDPTYQGIFISAELINKERA